MKKRFDCVEMQHRGGELVRKMTEGMTVEEEVAFWKERTHEMVMRHRTKRTKGKAPRANVADR